jgi:hypothetical protein
MQQLKKTGDYTIYQKKSGRYAVMGKDKQFLHGEDKTRILLAEALVKQAQPKSPAASPETPATE